MGPIGPMPAFYSHPLRKLPEWAKQSGTVFALDGAAWRVHVVGSHNNTPERSHICWCNIRQPVDADGRFTCVCPPRLDMFVEYVQAIPLGELPVQLPAVPCTKSDLAASLGAAMRQGRVFTPLDMKRAIHVVDA